MTKHKFVELIPGKLYQVKTLKAVAIAAVLGTSQTMWYRSTQAGELKTFLILDVKKAPAGPVMRVTLLDSEGQIHTHTMDIGCWVHSNMTAL